MTKQYIQLEPENYLSRFKLFSEKHPLNRTVYRNRGVLQDAERFSLVDNVLDGEYNDMAILKYRQLPFKTRTGLVARRLRGQFACIRTRIARGLFLSVLLSRFTVYFIFHLGYKAK